MNDDPNPLARHASASASAASMAAPSGGVGPDGVVMAEVLAEQYGMDVIGCAPVAMGTQTVNRVVELDGGHRVFVKEYRTLEEADRAWAAWEMSEYCARHRLPVPRVVLNQDGVLVTRAAGTVWVVTELADGRVADTPMTPASAEAIGAALGRMHRILAGYPAAARTRHTRWRTGEVDVMLRKVERVRQRATAQLEPRLHQLRQDLDQRCEDVRAHVPRLRAQLHSRLTVQPTHADFARTNLLLDGDRLTAVIDFQAENGVLAWELGRIAFDPRTVTHGLHWVQCALRLIEAYRAENPYLAGREVRACARIVLLYLLMSLYGATTREYQLPAAAAEDLCRYWDERQVTIRRMIAQLDEIEDALGATERGRRR
ncbi:phosphotransferase [Streptomyces sp. NPDC050095]|uniref:phosphotransferase enzyme family protein n=1 Tax=unclassified Streptomyces TaxID=2593676 RepID=UPI0034333013